MKILAIDTSERSCGIAVLNDDNLLAEITMVSRQTHSRHLMEMLDTALKISGLDVSELDVFVSAKGPGSFTGLRIGISVVKGLAYAADKPLIGVSNADALAAQCVLSDIPICVMIDARKSEVYTRCYHCIDLIPENNIQAMSPDDALSDIDKPYLFVGSGALLYREKILQKLGESARFAPDDAHITKASTLARLGLKRLLKGESDNAASFVPHYIRKADAKPQAAFS